MSPWKEHIQRGRSAESLMNTFSPDFGRYKPYLHGEHFLISLIFYSFMWRVCVYKHMYMNAYMCRPEDNLNLSYCLRNTIYIR